MYYINNGREGALSISFCPGANGHKLVAVPDGVELRRCIVWEQVSVPWVVQKFICKFLEVSIGGLEFWYF